MVMQSISLTLQIPRPRKPIICTLEKTCTWGGADEICCISCSKINRCKVTCIEAKAWISHRIRCIYGEVMYDAE